MIVYPIDIFHLRFVSTIHIDFVYIITLIVTSLYQLCQSLVIIECYILMLYHDCLSLIYFIALCVLRVFYVQRCRTLWFSAI